MSLQLILGQSGGGKTHCLYENITKEAIQNPSKNYLVIVPEQFTMQTQKELVELHPNKGIMNIDVLSFARLAHRILGELGRNDGILLDDEGKNLILRKIAGNYEADLKILGKNLKKFGYISEVKSVISEFTQYNLGIEALEEFKSNLPGDSMLFYKLDDICTVYKGFQSYLEGKYITNEELLDQVTLCASDSAILKDSVITFDGFTGFTPVQYRLIEVLLKLCSKVYITMTIGKKEHPYSYQHPYQLFGLSKETIVTLMKLCQEAKVEIEEPILLFDKETSRFKENDALGFLEEELFRYGKKSFEQEQNSIRIHALRNPKEEAYWAAGEIRRLAREEGYRYRDIAIITSSMEGYGHHLKRACEEYDIPTFTDHKRSILLNAFVEYGRSLLAMVESNYTYDSVFRFLKSGFVPVSSHRIDLLENFVLANGIKGFKKWQEPWTDRRLRTNQEGLDLINGLRVEFVEMMMPLQLVLKERRKTVQDICTAIYEFFVTNKIQQRVERFAEEFQESGELSLAKEYSQIYGITMELFDKFVSILGDEVVGLKEFNELLDAGLQEARVGIIPPSIDCVIIGDLQRTRLNNIKALFFLGANDSHLPGKMNASGLLSEHDRDVFASNNIRLKAGGKEQMYIQKFYLYLNLTKPSERLYLSYAKTSGDGKSGRPAYLIHEIHKLFPRVKVTEIIPSVMNSELTPQGGLQYIIEGLNDPKLQENPEWIGLLDWYKSKEEWKELITMLITANQYRAPEDKLSREIAKALYGEVLKNSVTRLEKFASCPYAHFLNHGLGIRERDLYEFEASDLGNIFHEAIEHYAKQVHASGKDWTTLSREEQEQLSNQVVDESIEQYENAMLYKSERDKYNIERIKRLMRRSVWAVTEQLACGEFRPEGFEVTFGTDDGLESTTIPISDDQVMKLRGQIDRVDLCESDTNIFVKILDYKTGSKELNLAEVYEGLQLQLFVYLNTALEIERKKQDKEQEGKQVIPAGVLYYRMDDPLVEVDLSEAMNAAEEDQLIEMEILNKLTPDGLVNKGANVLELLDHTFDNKSYAVPVTKDSKGEIKKTSKAVDQSELETICAFTSKKIQELGTKMADGIIEVKPYQKKDGSGCMYCKFNQICGFDIKIPGYSYRKVSEAKQEAALELMKQTMEEEGQ